MRINVAKLKEFGLEVNITDQDGLPIKNEDRLTVNVFPRNTHLPEAIIELVNDAVQTPEYADAVISNIVGKIQMFQILEAIDRTGR